MSNDRPHPPDPMACGASLAAVLLTQTTLSALVMRGLLPKAGTDAIIDQCQWKLEEMQGHGGFVKLVSQIAHSHLEETRNAIREAPDSARPRPSATGG